MFSSVVASATQAVNSTVIRPSLEKATDPNFRAGIVNYVSESTKNANEWGKSQLGVDVGGVVGSVASNVAATSRGAYSSVSGNNPASRGYGRPQQYGGYDHDEDSALYADAGDDDFFQDFNKQTSAPASSGSSAVFGGGASASSSKPTNVAPSPAPPNKPKNDNWNDDEWKDF